MTIPDASRSSLGIDSRSLDALRNEATRNPNGAARQAAVQFESLFMQMVLKSMRDATLKAEDNPNSGGDTFTSMLDSQMAKQFAGRPGGLADMIERQLSRHMPAPAVALPDNAVLPGSAATPIAGAPSSPRTGAFAVSSGEAPAAPAVKPGSLQAKFMAKMTAHAQAAERETGVPASFILGQAALESGWGQGEIRHANGAPSFNLFGIKATPGWKGATAEVKTTEYVGGEPVKQVARFRSYGSYSEAFADYARMLANSPRYSGVVRGATSVAGFANGMQQAGYATDPAYASKLTRTINLALAVQRSTG